MIKFLMWILSIPSGKSGKSGKREMAVIVAIFTIGMIAWSWPSMSEQGRVDILFWLMTASVILLAAAFGMESLVSQAGLRLGKRDKTEHYEEPLE